MATSMPRALRMLTRLTVLLFVEGPRSRNGARDTRRQSARTLLSRIPKIHPTSPFGWSRPTNETACCVRRYTKDNGRSYLTDVEAGYSIRGAFIASTATE